VEGAEMFDSIISFIIFGFLLFLVFGEYILQRDRYWQRRWEDLGRPNVQNIKELKALWDKRGGK